MADADASKEFFVGRCRDAGSKRNGQRAGAARRCQGADSNRRPADYDFRALSAQFGPVGRRLICKNLAPNAAWRRQAVFGMSELATCISYGSTNLPDPRRQGGPTLNS